MKQVYRKETIQIAGGFLFNGLKFDGFSATVESASSFNATENWWEVWFKSEFPKIEGNAIYNEELDMWDLIEDECKGTLINQ